MQDIDEEESLGERNKVMAKYPAVQRHMTRSINNPPVLSLVTYFNAVVVSNQDGISIDAHIAQNIAPLKFISIADHAPLYLQ